MTGCQLWGGTLCGPVGTTREASNMVQSGFPVPPLHVHCAPLLMENAPELLALKESTPSCPVMLRISSRPQAPASRSWPSTQARKGRGPGHNRRKHYAIFKELPPFRAWVLGADGMAGSHNKPGLPNIRGQATAVGNEDGFISPGGNVAAGLVNGAIIKGSQCTHGSAMSSSNYGKGYALGIDASKSNDVYGAASTVMPPSINVPVIIYLGSPR